MSYRVVKCPKGKIVEVTDYGLNKCVICPRACPEKDCAQKNFRLLKKFFASGSPSLSVRNDSSAAPTAKEESAPDSSAPTASSGGSSALEETQAYANDSFGDVFFDDEPLASDNKESAGLGYSPLSDLDEPEQEAEPQIRVPLTEKPRADSSDEKTVAGKSFSFKVGARTFGEPREALDFLLRFWLVDKLLSRDGKDLTPDAENAVLSYGGASMLKEVYAVCGDDSVPDRNDKFFCIYYEAVFPQLRRRLLYYYYGDDYGEKPPLCRNTDDFFGQIKAGGWLSRNFDKMLLPLSVYFGLTSKEELYDHVTAEMFSRYGVLYVYLPEEKAFRNFGKLDRFVSELPEVRDYSEIYAKYSALTRTAIRNTDEGFVPEKGDGLFGVRKEGILKPDDGVYELLGIGESARSLGIYSIWICLLHAYTAITQAAQVSVGGVTYTKNDIYDNFVRVIREAFECGKTAEFFLLKSLIANGILTRFTERCEARKIGKLTEKIVDSESVEECYYFCDDIEHLLRDGGKTVRIEEYLDSLMAGGSGFTAVNARLGRDENLKTWISARLRQKENEFADKRADLDRLAAECERIYGKRREI